MRRATCLRFPFTLKTIPSDKSTMLVERRRHSIRTWSVRKGHYHCQLDFHREPNMRIAGQSEGHSPFRISSTALSRWPRSTERRRSRSSARLPAARKDRTATSISCSKRAKSKACRFSSFRTGLSNSLIEELISSRQRAPVRVFSNA